MQLPTQPELATATEPPRSPLRLTKTAPIASQPLHPTLRLSSSWSRTARLCLSRMAPKIAALQLKKTAQTAIVATLQMAPPRYPALKSQLKNCETSVFNLDLSWVDDAKIHSLNRDYRGKDKPTDVLSFALFEMEDEGDVIVFPGEENQIALGDLVISIETAARQAQELKHSLDREIAFLAIHGTLHLLGYDHGNGSDRRLMWKWQDSLFEEHFSA